MVVEDLKSNFQSILDKTNVTKEEVLNYLNEQNKEIEKWKKLDRDLINSLPSVLHDKFNNKLNNAGDNITSLKKLYEELKEYQRVSNLATKINDIYTQGNIFRDINSSNLSELPAIEEQIKKILEEQSKSEFQKLKEQVIELNSLIKDKEIHDGFAEEINIAAEDESIEKLLKTKKKIEDYLKEHAGANGFIEFKKEALKEKVNNSNLSEEVKNNFLEKIDAVTEITELNKLEKKIDDAIKLLTSIEEAEKLIKLLNNPKKDELLEQLYDSKIIEDVYIPASEAAKILSEQKKIAKDKIKRLDGDFETKNNFISRLTEAKKESEFIDLAAQVDQYFVDLTQKVQDEINKIDQNDAKKEELQQRLNVAKQNPNTTAGVLIDIFNDARAQDNFEEYKKEAIEKAKKLEDEEKSKKFISDLENAKTLDEVIKLKEQVDTAYQFQLDKKKAETAIERVKHVVKKAQLTEELNEATTSEELIKLTFEANKYADFEIENNIKYLQLKDFVENNITKQDKKDEFNELLDNDLKDQQGQNNIDQEQIRLNLDETSKQLDQYITNKKQLLKAIKDRILGKLALIKDEEKSNSFEDERVLLQEIEDAKALEERVDTYIEFERNKENILEKIGNLLDKKDYIDQLNNAQNLDDLKRIEALVDSDLAREAEELRIAKENAIEKLTHILDSNENKNPWANKVSEARDPKVVNEVIKAIEDYLDSLREKANEAIKKVVGDQQNHSELVEQLSQANSEKSIRDITLRAEELFSNKFNDTNSTLENLSKDHPMWENLNSEVKAAKNIEELNLVKAKIEHAITVDEHKKQAKKLLEQVQDKEVSPVLLERIENSNDVNELVQIKEDIKQQIQNEADEIKANVDKLKEQVAKLFTQENIDKFNEIIANTEISLEDSRKAVEAINEAYIIEQNQLKDAKKEAFEELKKLLDSPEKTAIRDQIESAQNILIDMAAAKQAIKDRIAVLKTEAINATNKLNNRDNRINQINDAITQEEIDGFKNASVNEFNAIRDEIIKLANNTLNIDESLEDKTRILQKINDATTENLLLAQRDEINNLLEQYKTKAKTQVERLIDETVNNDSILSGDIDSLNNQSEIKKHIEQVNNIINSRLATAEEVLAKLVGNDIEHTAKQNKLDDLKTRKDVVTEQEINELIKLINKIFDNKKIETNTRLQQVTNEQEKQKLLEEFNNANSIEKLNELDSKIAVQLKKEEILQTLPKKIKFIEQREGFETRINDSNTNSLEQLEQIEQEINQKSEYNKALKQKTDDIKAELEKIDVDTTLKNSLTEELNNARTIESAEAVQAKINERINNLRDQALEAIKGLEGSDEKQLKESELANANSESLITKIINDSNKFLEDKRKALIELNNSTNTELKDDFLTKINEAKNISDLNELEKQINNQNLREETQKWIDKLNQTPEKEGFQTELNAIQNNSDDANEKLSDLLNRVKVKASSEGHEFDVALEEAKQAVALLSNNNPKKQDLLNRISTLENVDQSGKVASEAIEIKEEATRLVQLKKSEIKELIKKLLNPVETDNEKAPLQSEKYNSLINKVDGLKNETDIQNVYDIDAKEYFNTTKSQYKNNVERLLPEVDELRKQEQLNRLEATENINELNDTLKAVNLQFSNLVKNEILDVETEEKKTEFTSTLEKINSNDVTNDNGETTTDNTKWQTRLSELKKLYDLVIDQKQQEADRLRLYKETLSNDIKTTLIGEEQDSNTPENDKNNVTKLLEKLNKANTLEKAKAIRTELDEIFKAKKDIVKAVIELANGHDNYNNLLSGIENATTEERINQLQSEAQEYINEAKNSAKSYIDQVENDTTDPNLLSRWEKVGNTVADFKKLETEAKIIKKKAELKKKVDFLWNDNKSNFVERMDQLIDNTQQTLDSLAQIEEEINNAITEQNRRLEEAKTQANEVINRLRDGHDNPTDDKTSKLQAVKDATTLEIIEQIKSDAQTILNDRKNIADISLAKINVTDLPNQLDEQNPLRKIVDLFHELEQLNTQDATEATYDSIKSRADKAFEDYKAEVRSQITNNISTKGEELLNRISGAQTIDELHQLVNANEVYLKADEITEKLKEHAENDVKNRFNEELRIIKEGIEPSTDKVAENETLSKKQKDLNSLSDLLNRINEAVDDQNEQLRIEGDKARKVIELINGNDQAATSKKDDLNTRLEEALRTKNVEAIKVITGEAQEFIRNKMNEAQELLNKLTLGKSPRTSINGVEGLQDKFNKATTQTDFENIKTKVEEALNGFKEEATAAVAKLGDELNSELDAAKLSHTQLDYDNLIEKVNRKLNEYKERARRKLAEANLENSKTFENDINSAETKAKIEEIEAEIQKQKELEAAIREAKLEINKLNNPLKDQLLNSLNEENITKEEVNRKKEEAISALNSKKEAAKAAARKFDNTPDDQNNKYNILLNSAVNESDFDSIIQKATNEFNTIANNVNSDIALLKDGDNPANKPTGDALTKENVSEINKLHNQALDYARIYVNKAINEAPANKQEALRNKLSSATSVQVMNDIMEEANAARDLAAAKEEAKRNARAKLDGHEDLENIINQIDAAETPEQLSNVSSRVQPLVEAEANKLTVALRKLNDDNQVKTENKTKNETNSSVKQLRDAFKAINDELDKIQAQTLSDIEKIHLLSPEVTNESFSNEWNRDYQNTNPKGVKNKFDEIVQNRTERALKELSAEVETLLANKKEFVKNKIEALENSVLKERLKSDVELDSNKTYDNLAKLYKDVLTGKTEEQRQAKLSEVKVLIEKLKNYVDNKHKDNYLNEIEEKSYDQLEQLKTQVEYTLQEELEIARRRTIEEVKKLPSQTASYNRSNLISEIESSRNINDILTKETATQATNQRLIDELNAEIEKMPENARTPLTIEKDAIISPSAQHTDDNTIGDKLLALKQKAETVVAKSNELKAIIDTHFPASNNGTETDGGTHKYREWLKDYNYNSDKADTVEEIEQIINIANELKTAYDSALQLFETGIKNNPESLDSTKDIFTKALWHITGNLSNKPSVSSLTLESIKSALNDLNDQMIRNRDIVNYVGQAKELSRSLEEGQRIPAWSEGTLNAHKQWPRTSEIEIVKSKIEAMNVLKSKLDQVKEKLDEPSNFEGADALKEALLTKWRTTNTIGSENDGNNVNSANGLYNNISNSSDGLITQIANVKAKIEEVTNLEEKQGFKDRLNRVETREQISQLLSDIEREKLIQESKPYINRLLEGQNKTDYQSKINKTQTIEIVRENLDLLKTYLTNKQNDAKSSIARLMSNGNNGNYSENLNKANNNNSTEAQYNEVKSYVQSKIDVDYNALQEVIGHFDGGTRNAFTVDQNTVSQQVVREKLNSARALNAKYNELNRLIENKFRGNSLNELKQRYKTELDAQNKTLEKLLDIERRINEEISSRKSAIQSTDFWDWRINENKKREFIDRWNSMVNNDDVTIEELESLANEIKNYNELRISAARRDNEARYKKFILGSNDGLRQAKIDITFFRLGEMYNNKTLYAVAKNSNGDRVVSRGRNNIITSDDSRYTYNGMGFIFEQNNVRHTGQYTIEKVVYGNSGLSEQDVLNETTNVVLRSSTNDALFEGFEVIQKPNVFARNMSISNNRRNRLYNLTYGFDVNGLFLEGIGNIDNNSIEINMFSERISHRANIRNSYRNSSIITTSLQNGSLKFIVDTNAMYNDREYMIETITFTANGKKYIYNSDGSVNSESEIIDYHEHNFANNNMRV
ncbi:hypothetical protein [Mycoplasma sp. OR1901]|uniref:hypothetical protein n=1 Tax=Mycoplasma sp. OR1901 TaxID=2742195 RepID=UPI001582BF84|nr:hypothetical protein [Mycoplasma sp. OR1901]QKT05240.1 hypothetical protein HTZ87_00770 [Mycoplasma sp. OR1901]